MQEVGVVTDQNWYEIVGASNIVTGMAVQEDLGWRKGGER